MRNFLLILICCSWFAASYSQSKKYFWTDDVIHLSKQPEKYVTQIFGAQDGLPSSEITCLAQDSNGFLWVGTPVGLSRFDGRSFKNFLKAGNQRAGRIYSIKEDTIRKVLWIACNTGLYYLKNEELFAANIQERGLTVYDICLDKNNNMWLATSTGPAFFNSKIIYNLLSDSTVNLQSFLLPEWQNYTQPNKQTYKITVTGSGNLYFAGQRALFLYAHKTIERIWASSFKGNNNDNVVGLVAGRQDSVFFASAFGGVHCIVKNTISKVADGNTTAAALTEHNGQLFYFTAGGIYKLYPSTKRLEKISEVPDIQTLSKSCVLIDNENNLWIGMHDKLVYQKPCIFFSYNEPGNTTPEIYSIYQLKNNQLLFGINKGKVYSKNGPVLKNYLPANSSAISEAEIKTMYQDTRRWLWMGSDSKGISIMKNKRLIHFNDADGLISNGIYFFHEDSLHNIYAGGDGGFSRVVYDSLTGRFLFKNFFFKLDDESTGRFRSCISGPDGSLWFTTENGILHFKNDKLIRYELDGMDMLNATDIKRDQVGRIWIATKGDGIWQCFFDDKNLLRVTKIITDKDGLQSNIYLSIATDSQNNIWAAGYRGITSIKEKNDRLTIFNYTAVDGFLSSNYQSIKLFHDADDMMWIVTSAGLMSFNTANAAIHKTLSLSFTNIFLLGGISQESNSAKKNELYSGIELPYYLNGIEFQYKAICLSDSRRIRYSYRMLGLQDTTWIDWMDKEIAIYQNLAPGKYSFQLKALLDNNIPSRLVTFSFTINKPFWFSWWFILITGCLFFTIVYLLIKKWKKEVQYKNEEKIKTQKLISEHLQYRLEVEEVTNYFNQLMSATETEDELLWDVARQCISKLNFEDCVIYLKDKNNNVLIQKAAWGPKVIMVENDPLRKQAIVSPIEIPVGKGIVGNVAKTGIAEIVADVTKDPRYILDDAQRCSEIAVPIVYENRVLGVIDSESSHFNYYNQWHLQILTDIALHCAERIVKLRADKSLQKNRIQLLQARQLLAEERLTALRSQMNPHFIFNSLNSIQQFVLKGDVESANKYLSQFSRLIRLVLQYSEANFITLDEEIDMLRLYLSLEKIRFGDSFEYNIYLEETIDVDEIKIPNLMVQPFVENAIWHGLMHKEGDRKIEIRFSLLDDKALQCEIVDNGIGRHKSEAIKKTKSVDIKHQSKGMQLIQDKSEILKQQFNKEVLIEINDVTNEASEVSGTRVSIKLPLTD